MMTLLYFAVAGILQAQSVAPLRYSIGTPAWQDIWVDPVNGNDSNVGATRGASLRTVTAAWGRIPARQALTSAYRIRLVSGTYSSSAVPVYWESRWGTALAPILIEAVDGPGTVTLPALNIFDCRYLYLTGLRSTSAGGDVFHCEKCDHLLLRQVTITGTGDIRNYSSPQETVKINQSQYVYIEDSDVSGAYDNAIDMVAVQYGHVLGNKIHHAVDWCMYLKGGSAQFRVEGNEIYDCGTGGFTAGQGTGFEYMTRPWIHYEAYDVKFVNNVVHDTEGAGFGVNGGYNILLAHNTLYRVGARSHGMEFVFGGHSCDGNTQGCASNRAAGGWGPGTPGSEEVISNRNVFAYNNLLLNPTGTRSQWQHFAVSGPRNQSGATSPNPARADVNLQVRGNVVWNGPSDLPLGVGEGCAATNTTCNADQLRAENAINAALPVLTSDYRPASNSGLTAARTYSIPNFTGGDQPSGVPVGNLDNTVGVDRDGRARTVRTPGAYEVVTAPATASVTAAPEALRFVSVAGSSTGVAQSLSLTGSATFNVTSSAAWLTVSPTAGTAPTSIVVTANAASLGAGTYSGSLTVQPTGGTSIPVSVTLVVFSPGASSQVFNDVPSSSLFLDFVFLLSRLGITAGCAISPPGYCPNAAIEQQQMAVFVVRSLLGDSFPYPTSPYFTDVPNTSVYFKYVQKMRELNINLGCGGNQFCPTSAVTRAQMAQYIVKGKFGDSFPYPAAGRFSDVPSGDSNFTFVQKLWDMGVTVGCTESNYCPSQPVTREQMAAFIIRAFFGYGVVTPVNPNPPNPPPPPAPPPAGSAPQIAGCNVFPSDNVWNTAVDALPVHTRSGDWVTTIGATRTFHADFGSGLWDGGPIGIPFVVVPQGQAKVSVAFDYDDESDPGPYPIPSNAPIEGGAASDGDRHVLVLEQGTCKLYETFSSYPQTNGSWRAGSGAIYDLKVNGPLRPQSWTSADAAGLPILPGLVRYDEVAAGEVNHAIRFTVPQSKKEFIWPARHQASSLTGTQYPPMGARFRLKASYNISGFSAPVQVILRAMKKYGILLADNGSAWYISGAPDERWNNDQLHEFGRLPGSAFEAVDTSSMVIDGNSGQARQP